MNEILPQLGQVFAQMAQILRTSYNFVESVLLFRQFLVNMAQMLRTLPPLIQFLGILAQLLPWCHAHSDVFTIKRPMHPTVNIIIHEATTPTKTIFH